MQRLRGALGRARERLGDGDEDGARDGRQRHKAHQQRDQRQDLHHVRDCAHEAPLVHLHKPSTNLFPCCLFPATCCTACAFDEALQHVRGWASQKPLETLLPLRRLAHLTVHHCRRPWEDRCCRSLRCVALNTGLGPLRVQHCKALRALSVTHAHCRPQTGRDQRS